MPEKANASLGYYLTVGASIAVILGFFGIRGIRDLLPAKSEVPSNIAPAAARRSANVAGEWRGYATSSSQRFPYHWIISQDGSNVSGSIDISLAPGLYHASYSFEGCISSDTRLTFRGLRFNEYAPPPSGAWCLASGELYLSRSKDGRDIILHGTWTQSDVPGGCPAGTGGQIQLVRQ